MAGPGTSGFFFSFGAEELSGVLRIKPSVGVAIGANTITFPAGSITTGYLANPETMYAEDATNPNAFPFGTWVTSYNDHSITLNLANGEVFTASFSGTSMNVTALTGGTGSIAVGAPLWDASGDIPSGTVVTACPGNNCSATGTYTISQSAGTIASETVQTGCGTGVCMPIPASDTITLNKGCVFSNPATNQVNIHNNDFVAFAATEDGDHGYTPMQFVGQDYTSWLPGDTNWPFAAAADWNITDNIVSGICVGTHNPAAGQDTNGSGGNTALYFSDFPWFDDTAFDWGTNPHISLVISPAELTQSFRQSLVPKIADASDSGNLGTLAYVHAAMPGLARALETIGAVD